ncbi:biotin carboxylase N-terminal domain-containing protein, partial [Campylobacter concisus]|uniref:biotin carboxylase N-terminal domain-containing protein n=1 Tax=Campylobacter concisus TaxID=199 RepID=UPI0023BA1B70
MEFKRILIANRGEIALRASRTIKEMGKAAEPVHSTADKDALYAKHADVATSIGIEPSSATHPNIPALISAAAIRAADPILPGHGSLRQHQNILDLRSHHKTKIT